LKKLARVRGKDEARERQGRGKREARERQGRGKGGDGN
jgi:hypothetical protein